MWYGEIGKQQEVSIVKMSWRQKARWCWVVCANTAFGHKPEKILMLAKEIDPRIDTDGSLPFDNPDETATVSHSETSAATRGGYDPLFSGLRTGQ